MHRSLIALVLVCLAAGGCGDAAPEAPGVLADGVYEVLAVAQDPAALPAGDADTRVLLHDHRHVRGGAELAPDHVLLRVAAFAHLDLAEAPRTGDAGGRPVLLLTLRPAAGEALAEMTGRVGRAAVVIGGDVVSVHGIREPIRGGALQVSC